LGQPVGELLQRHLDGSQWTAALFAEMVAEVRL